MPRGVPLSERRVLSQKHAPLLPTRPSSIQTKAGRIGSCMMSFTEPHIRRDTACIVCAARDTMGRFPSDGDLPAATLVHIFNSKFRSGFYRPPHRLIRRFRVAHPHGATCLLLAWGPMLSARAVVLRHVDLAQARSPAVASWSGRLLLCIFGGRLRREVGPR